MISRTLNGVWREPLPSRLDISSAEFDEVTPRLYDSGAAALGWWRIRATDLRHTASGEMLHQAFRLLALQAAIHETKIRKVFKVLRDRNVEPILIKGWAVARRYPNTALRPFGDIDLITRAGDNDAVSAALNQLRDCQLDFHRLPFELADRSIDELFSRSRLVPCVDENVRVLSDEDHYALLAVHLLKHGAWRPLWLCDLAVLLEATTEDFDWNLCLGKHKKRANWILAATGLARKLLGASIRDERIAARATPSPEWLTRQVLEAWETPYATAQAPQRHAAPIDSYFRRPRGLLGDLARRWPNPIVATISVNGTFGSRRRRRYEIGNWLLRAGRLANTASGAAPELS